MLFQVQGEGLGRIYRDGETIIHQGEHSSTLFVIEEGTAEVVATGETGREVRLGVLEKDDVFGELSSLDALPRSASVRALGDVRLITVDSKGFLRHVQEDPSFALRVLGKLAERIRRQNMELIRLKLGEEP